MSVQVRLSDEAGASAIEYSMIVAGIAAVIVVIVFALGRFTGGMFSNTCENLAKGEYNSTPATCS